MRPTDSPHTGQGRAHSSSAAIHSGAIALSGNRLHRERMAMQVRSTSLPRDSCRISRSTGLIWATLT